MSAGAWAASEVPAGATVPKASAADPVSPQEAHALIAAALTALHQHTGAAPAQPTRFGLAVSGGPDSLAMLAFAADWSAIERAHGAGAVEWHVLTVDHGLRPASAAEAAHVGTIATRHGMRHDILRWTGPKPTTSLMAEARGARYALLGAHARAHGLAAVLCAHTAEDQAETVLMRLARGSGIDGVAGMKPAGVLDGLVVVRPLLDVRKQRLLASLAARGIAWMQDPTNHDATYERTRWRASLPMLAELGLTVEALGRSARRAARASKGLEAATAGLLRGEEARRNALLGYAAFAWPAWRAYDEELKVRAIAVLVHAIGGAEIAPALSQIENVVAALDGDRPKGCTLARCQIAVSETRLLLVRELRRHPPPTVALEPGQQAVWDNRFRVSLSASARMPLQVRALGSTRQLEALGPAVARAASRHPARALRVLPSFWAGERLEAVPSLLGAPPSDDGALAGACAATPLGVDGSGRWSLAKGGARAQDGPN